MSGHSKWSTIKHQKGVADVKRGKVFSKFAKALSVAVKEGNSADPNFNSRLRLEIDRAKAVNMPKENIKRAIERGLGKGEGASWQSITYEGFGPEGIAIIVECVTDNKNRTGAEIKSFFDRKGGKLGEPGSASYLFSKKALILVTKGDNIEEQVLKLIDLGALDVEVEEKVIEVYDKPDQLEEIRKKIETEGMIIEEAALGFRPNSLISLDNDVKKKKVINFLADLDEMDDVQKIYCNVDL